MTTTENRDQNITYNFILTDDDLTDLRTKFIVFLNRSCTASTSELYFEDIESLVISYLVGLFFPVV